MKRWILCAATSIGLLACVGDPTPVGNASTEQKENHESQDESQSQPPSSDSTTPIEVDDSVSGSQYVGFAGDGKADNTGITRGKVTFEHSCSPGERTTIAAVGDVLLHGRLQRQAYAEGSNHTSLWKDIQPFMEAADVTYANLEGTVAPGVISSGENVEDPGQVYDDYVYSSYPTFNYHPSLLDGLNDSSVDVVSTANNHSLDRRELGVNKTLEQLKNHQIKAAGTVKSQSGPRKPWTVTEQQGFRIAWLACTYATNGIPDTADQVQYCYRDDDKMVENVERLSSRSDIDAVIATPHWGAQYTANPKERQQNFAHRLLDAGATAVIGSHPHVIQPWEKYETEDGRETFVIYSLGNFVSGQRHLARRTTLVLFVGLTRTNNGVRINGVRYVPAHMTEKESEFLTLEASQYRPQLGRSFNHATNLLGHFNLQDAKGDLQMTPECNSEWKPPHPHDGWIGGACKSNQVCGGTSCDTTLPGGFCTKSCERLCPDQPGSPTTFCIDLGDGSGSCALQCETPSECRDGYTCKEVPRFNESSVREKVCVPEGF